MSRALVRQAVLFGFTGLALGVAQLLSLRTVVRTCIAGRSVGRSIALHLGRLTPILAAWVMVARLGGALGLLAALAGFLVARPLVMAGTRQGPP